MRLSLDTFKYRGYNKISNKLEAWLSFFTYEQPEEIISLVNSFPEFTALYKDIAEFRRKPEEVIGMFSEALRIMDRNTTKYMIEDLQKQFNEAEVKLGMAVAECDEAEARRDEAETKLDEAVAERDEANAKIATKDKELAEKDREIAELKARLAQNKK